MEATKKELMYERIEKHGNNLIKLFNLPTDTDPIKLCKKLHALENQANALTTHECNTGESKHVELCKILEKVKRILFPDSEKMDVDLFLAVFINGDPRGYTLKIKEMWMRKRKDSDLNISFYRDMGGYGIIAPDFTND